ncbi:MAG: fumarylacetoacetate hydrolase family protein, partial [Lentisphaeria bacterium]
LAGDPFEGAELTDYSGDTIPMGKIDLLAPVKPPNVCAIGLNYRDHARESGKEIPDHPLLFLKATSSVTSHNSEIQLPAMAPDEVDYEAELAVVIGRTAVNVSEAEAPDYIFGYTCGNDVSARDCQARYDSQWARAKSFDTFCPLGPWIETELDPRNLRIESRVNDTVMQSARTSDMIFACFKLVSFLSKCMTLYPRTVIMTGTPAGVGAGRNPPVFLRDGDLVEIEVEGIGRLSNRVVRK